MVDFNLVNQECKKCSQICSGMAKHILTVDELYLVPDYCFVKEIDLEEADKKLISNQKREGAHIALIDALKWEELEELKSTIGFLDRSHYMYNQTPWVKKAKEIYLWDHQGKEPSVDEEFEMNCRNDPRYRLEYALLFPEMVNINGNATKEKKLKLRKFLDKSTMVVLENIKVNNYMGAPHLFRIQMREAENRGIDYRPSYIRAIFDGNFTLPG